MPARGERYIGRMAGIVERGTGHVEAMDGGGILDRIDEVEKLDKVARRTFGLTQGLGEKQQRARKHRANVDCAKPPAEREPSGD
jgi:hypothetical protein